MGLQELKEDKCPSCGESSMIVSLFQQYFHVLWLPVFPTRKKAAAQCLKCRTVVKEQAFSTQQKEVKGYLSAQFSTPMWCYSGMVLFAVLLFIKYI